MPLQIWDSIKLNDYELANNIKIKDPSGKIFFNLVHNIIKY